MSLKESVCLCAQLDSGPWGCGVRMVALLIAQMGSIVRDYDD